MSTRTRLLGALVLAAAAVATALTAAGPAGAQAAPQAAAPASGWVRLGHFAPAQAPVDVRLDGRVVATDVAFKEVTDYLVVPAGSHQFRIDPTGADGSGEPLLDVKAGVEADRAVTIAAVAARPGLAGQVYDDDLAPAPAGQALVRFIHASPDVASVDIGVVDGPALAKDVAYPAASPYQPVPAGTYDIAVKDSAAGTEVLRVAGWTAAPGTQNTVVVVRGLDGQPDVVPISDAGGAAAMPVGGMATGFGGLAPAGPDRGARSLPTPLELGLLTGGAAVLALGAARLTRTSRIRRPAAALALGGALGFGLASCGSPSPSADRSSPTTALRRTSTTAPTATTEPETAIGASAVLDAPVRDGANVNEREPAGEPRSVSIPAIGVSSELVPLGLAQDGTAEVPADPARAGWFTGGPRPGDDGPAVIAGHVDTRSGPAVFARLHELRAGDEVRVATSTGTETFAVERTEQVAKDAFPTDRVYGPAPGRQLRLITCGGTFDRGTGHYRDNVVVYLRATA